MHSLMSVWELYYLRGTEDAEDLREVCPKGAQRRSERKCHDSREMVELIYTDPTVLDALVTCDESWIYCYNPETKRESSQWKRAGSPRPKKARQSKSTHKLLMIPFFDSTGMIYILKREPSGRPRLWSPTLLTYSLTGFPSFIFIYITWTILSLVFVHVKKLCHSSSV